MANNSRTCRVLGKMASFVGIWCRYSGLSNHRSAVPAHTNQVCHLMPVPLAFVIFIPRNKQRCSSGILPCPAHLQSRVKAAAFVWQRCLASWGLMLPSYFHISDWYRLSLCGSGDPLFRSPSMQTGTVHQSAGCYTTQHMRATDVVIQDCIFQGAFGRLSCESGWWW